MFPPFPPPSLFSFSLARAPDDVILRATDNWLQLTEDVASNSLSDHQARSVTLRNPYIPAAAKDSSGAVAGVALRLIALQMFLLSLWRV